ncbi:MAG: hypothetical protein WCR42_10795 [bacterium]
MKNSIILLMILLGIIAFTACNPDTPVTPDDKTVTISANITQDMTFKDGFTYIIKNVVLVQNATVTIQPGATIRFMANARLAVGQLSNEPGTIKAIGTAAKPITFTSNDSNPDKGDWDCLYLYEGAKDCEFEYCVFEYGGGNDVTKAMVVIKLTEVSFKSCTFRKSESSGIYMMKGASFKNFTLNTLTDNTAYPIIITPNYVHTIGAANTFVTTSGIIIQDEEYLYNPGTYTWLNHGIPYIIKGDVRVGSAGEGVTLNIEPGTVLKFMTDGKFVVPYSPSEFGTLNAIGTATQKIIFTTNASSPAKSDWHGFIFNIGARNCNFDYCEITNAGNSATNSAVFYLSQCGTQVKISNSLIAHSISYGISVDKTSSLDKTTIVFEDIDKETYHVR